MLEQVAAAADDIHAPVDRKLNATVECVAQSLAAPPSRFGPRPRKG
jgi:hypothetical protein